LCDLTFCTHGYMIAGYKYGYPSKREGICVALCCSAKFLFSLPGSQPSYFIIHSGGGHMLPGLLPVWVLRPLSIQSSGAVLLGSYAGLDQCGKGGVWLGKGVFFLTPFAEQLPAGLDGCH
jgi:hypothetical protein